MRKNLSAIVLSCLGAWLQSTALPSPDSASPDLAVAEALKSLRGVGPEGRGNPPAARAWRELVEKSTADALPQLLEGLDGAGPLAANWIRGAADAIAERALKRGEKLPAQALQAFVEETRHAPRARRLAFEWLIRVEPQAEELLMARMLDDPSVELRRDAVARLLRQAREAETAGKDAETLALSSRALAAARDTDQIKEAVERLRRRGQEVDLARHYGFLMEWKIIGPFDNGAKTGFARAYGPEVEVKAGAEYDGKAGRVHWVEHGTRDELGTVDLNKVLCKEKGVLAYALHEFTSEKAQAVELRLSTLNAWKLWLNGELLFAHDEYHHGTELDHYRVEGRLKPGRNLILLKVCQNEQTEDYAEPWIFQLRVSDASGTAILSTTRPATKAARKEEEKP